MLRVEYNDSYNISLERERWLMIANGSLSSAHVKLR